MSLILLGILNSQAVAAGPAGAYDLLETQTLGTTAASVTFTGLGSYTDYKHLQLRMTVRSDDPDDDLSAISLRFNGDSGSNYANHQLSGNGSSVSSGASTSSTQIGLLDLVTGNLNTANVFGAGVMDILDFSSSSKNTTIRLLSGGLSDTESRINLTSGLWNSTAAVTSLALIKGDNFVAGSRFSLYGVR